MVRSINYILPLLDPHGNADQEILRPPYMRPKNGEGPINEMESSKFYEQTERYIRNRN
jgi:hypothetical protein